MPSKLYVYDATSMIDRIQAGGRFEGDDDVLTFGIESGVKELLEVFKRLVSDGRRFNRVVFQTHGSPGTIYFGDDPIDSNVWKGTFYGFNFENLFPKFTRMYFDGCNVADAEAGTNFLLAVGYVFLSKGGGDAFGWKNLGFGMPGLLPGIGGHTIHFGGSKNTKRIRFYSGGGGPNWPGSFVY
jgi:hypothetical protein